MGLVETVIEHLSVSRVFFFLVTAYLVKYIYKRLDEHRRIKGVADYGPTIKSYMPFGEFPSLYTPSSTNADSPKASISYTHSR